MGSIMHEIGHNFETAISPVSRGFSYITRAVSLVTLPLTFFPNKYAQMLLVLREDGIIIY